MAGNSFEMMISNGYDGPQSRSKRVTSHTSDSDGRHICCMLCTASMIEGVHGSLQQSINALQRLHQWKVVITYLLSNGSLAGLRVNIECFVMACNSCDKLKFICSAAVRRKLRCMQGPQWHESGDSCQTHLLVSPQLLGAGLNLVWTATA